MPLFLSGEIPGAQRVNDALYASRTVYQTATQTNTTTTAVASTSLILPVTANTTYVLEATIFYDTSSAADFLLAFAAPAGFSVPVYTAWAQLLADTAINSPIDHSAGTVAVGGALTSAVGGVASGTVMSMRPTGLIQIGSTPGDLQVKFAQWTSTPAVTTKLVAGSWMRLTKVA